MPEENKEINLLDYIIIFIKHKVFLLGTTFVFMVIFYLFVLIFVDEQFDSTATIIPVQDQSLSGIAGMLGDLGGTLPLGIGTSSNPEIGLYNTIINSRSLADSTINKFNLYDVYDYDKSVSKEVKKTRESFYNNITTEETEDGAYNISFRSPDTLLSANIVNFLVDYLNNKIIEYKIQKSKENRVFLEKRIEDIKQRLTNSEDSLRNYQVENNILLPEEQIKSIIGAYSILEKDLLTKQLQKDVLLQIYGENSPQVKNLLIEVKEFEKKLNSLKQNGKENSIFLPYKNIPQKTMEYLRLYREIEINSTILQFILPMFEQSKIEEQKDIPVIQIIDFARPAEEKSFPPRAILTLIFGFGVFSLLLTYLIIKNNLNFQQSVKLEFIRKNLFKINPKNM